ncbi:MAG: CARDB domain-containing protein, partial [Candidatus Saccharibacteria bacterium]|nr:CARDB domain-containing protein [Candidatus Saccharibacteria bacterium]
MSSVSIQVKLTPPPDLQVTALDGGVAGWSGQNITVNWTVTNVGTGTVRQNSWSDRIYLSSTQNLDVNNAVILGTVSRYGALVAGQSYSQSAAVKIPDGTEGKKYVIVVSDVDNQVPEYLAENNNTKTELIDVYLTPSPDIAVTTVNSPDSGYSGQPVSISWTVHNNGAGPTVLSSWYDAVYLSLDETLNTATDQFIGYRQHSGIMGPGESYTATAPFTLPVNFSGNYYVFVVADSTNLVYEHGSKDNNADYDTTTITISRPLPADLTISDIIVPATGVPGQTSLLNYSILNQSSYPTFSGWWDGCYLSSGTTWDLSAVPIAHVEHISPLGGNAAAPVNQNFSIPGVVPGEYYVLVKTDIYNQIDEGDSGKANNSRASIGKIQIDLPVLTIGTTQNDSIVTGQAKYYRFEAQEGKDILLTLTGSTSAANELYVRYGALPDRGHYDYLYNAPLQPNQEITIPKAPAGTYYIMVYCQNFTNGQQNYSLRADNMTFSIRSITPNRVGNGGSATIGIKGAGFDINDVVWLKSDDNNTIESFQANFINSSEMYARFDLRGIKTGNYRVVVRHIDGSEAELENGINVQVPSDTGLLFDITGPSTMRPGDIVEYTLQISNPGNNDVSSVLVALSIPNGQGYTIKIEGEGGEQTGVSDGTPIYYLIPVAPANSERDMHVKTPSPSLDADILSPPSQDKVPENTTELYPWFESGDITPDNLFAVILADKLMDALLDDSDLSKNKNAFRMSEILRGGKDPDNPTHTWTAWTSDDWRVYKAKMKWEFYLDYYQRDADLLKALILSGSADMMNSYYNNGFNYINSHGGANATTAVAKFLKDFKTWIETMKACFDSIPEWMSKYPGWQVIHRGYAPVIQKSRDPNKFIGPNGYSEKLFVTSTKSLSYKVLFENDPNATAPAREVWITIPLSSYLDLSKFKLGEIQFGANTISVPENLGYYQGQVPLKVNDKDILVKIEAGVNLGSYQAFWHLWTIDPLTGETPTDARLGFLPPDDPNKHNGEGYVTFSLKPKQEQATGTQIKGIAIITFDNNPPITTNEVFNTIDANAPTSSVVPLPAV